MSLVIKKIIVAIIAILAMFFLAGCSSMTHDVKVSPIDRAKLEITQPAPLALDTPVFSVIQYNGITFYAVTSTGYSILANNSEKVQNRLILDEQIINELRKYYENP